MTDQVHEFQSRQDIVAHLLNQHEWTDNGAPAASELLAVHRELHEIHRVDEQTRERYEVQRRAYFRESFKP